MAKGRRTGRAPFLSTKGRGTCGGDGACARTEEEEEEEDGTEGERVDEGNTFRRLTRFVYSFTTRERSG